ncbi:hypothetical protein [uncultured Endozoicomonas sp.]|uniref:hypothetical protein n=1 Tax=uncultured Endozoicomonas sp. TaxID=432652 RepID=UPI00261DFAC2|nr:hypothetical protein [uncultured Endozoicomonas sp.]
MDQTSSVGAIDQSVLQGLTTEAAWSLAVTGVWENIRSFYRVGAKSVKVIGAENNQYTIVYSSCAAGRFFCNEGKSLLTRATSDEFTSLLQLYGEVRTEWPAYPGFWIDRSTSLKLNNREDEIEAFNVIKFNWKGQEFQIQYKDYYQK